MSQKTSHLTTFFFRCWWTVLLILFCYGFYLHGMHKKKQMLGGLLQSVHLLEDQLAAARERKEDLLLQIQSQEDPAYIELLLKKQLGMVPYGQTKVYFEKE